MSERTVITTIEVTHIIKDMPEGKVINKKTSAESVKEAVKSATGADDVVVTNVQEFIGGAKNEGNN